jgi:hypothetical protein
LKIGDAAVPFGRIVFNDASDWYEVEVEEGTTEPQPTVQAADVTVILDPRTAEVRDQTVRTNPFVSAALSMPGPLPPVEVQWTVHPSSSQRETTNIVRGSDRALTTLSQDTPQLAVGQDRAPLTLRMPLYPVTVARGALPLTPATLIFGDPAYDRDLAGPPTEFAQRLDLADAEKAKLPTGRVELRIVLAADRGRVNWRGVVTFMLDVRFERPMDDLTQARAEAHTEGPIPGSAGDLTRKQVAVATLQLELQPKD